MAPCVTPLPLVSSTTVISSEPDDPLEHGSPRGIGERTHDSVDGGDFGHRRCTLVYAN